MRKGNLFVISGPSGTGKGTIVAEIVKQIDDVFLSISCTTRDPREGDKEGVTYFFKTREEFQELIDEDGLLEWAEYNGNFYGTPRAKVEQAIAEGKQVILEIEFQGAFQIREKMPDAHLVFVEPPSMEELERRLRGRNTEDEETILRRLETARVELSQKKEYDYLLVNEDLDIAVRNLADYINTLAER